MDTKLKRIGWNEMNLEEDQMIYCLRNIEQENSNDFWTDKVTIGKWYKITDLEWRFWDRVCIKADTGMEMFVPVEFFYSTLQDNRDQKIEEITK